ncbi:hypothetical protein RHGRI_020564 [Rhododendron griersonianum]|uniref:Protein ENHANCED DISEASE RESISTANCE 2 C-terminal domain-containing protein n=1 Tax=Rhododendron griersonianum TaxID=479676 RepID=A0AAV6JI40_9ERIC|nr:hypothetical protein RHGRI_020564 [Rhododendron griersonianum]
MVSSNLHCPRKDRSDTTDSYSCHVPKLQLGSWIVRQSVGSTPCLLGKAIDCNYIRGPKYLEANTVDELPERLIGAVRVSHIELKSAIVPNLDEEPSG